MFVSLTKRSTTLKTHFVQDDSMVQLCDAVCFFRLTVLYELDQLITVLFKYC